MLALRQQFGKSADSGLLATLNKHNGLILEITGFLVHEHLSPDTTAIQPEEKFVDQVCKQPPKDLFMNTLD